MLPRETSSKEECAVQENEKFINIELLHFDHRKFSLFVAACKKNGISTRNVIEKFFDNYIREVFGNDVNYADICKEDESFIEEY